MGFIPVFIVCLGVLVLWGMVVHNNLKEKLLRVQNLVTKLEEANKNQADALQKTATQKAYQYALRDYNMTLVSSPAKVWARVFGFKKEKDILSA